MHRPNIVREIPIDSRKAIETVVIKETDALYSELVRFL